ncbi:MAG: hypothetical protein RR364_04250 [Lachnospiraceae bacterium]
MFRLWGKIIHENHLVKDYLYCEESEETRTHKIFNGLEKICYEFDLEKPIWLDSNISEFNRVGKTRFRQDSFIEPIEFEYLEVHIIQED